MTTKVMLFVLALAFSAYFTEVKQFMALKEVFSTFATYFSFVYAILVFLLSVLDFAMRTKITKVTLKITREISFLLIIRTIRSFTVLLLGFSNDVLVKLFQVLNNVVTVISCQTVAKRTTRHTIVPNLSKVDSAQAFVVMAPSLWHKRIAENSEPVKTTSVEVAQGAFTIKTREPLVKVNKAAEDEIESMKDLVDALAYCSLDGSPYELDGNLSDIQKWIRTPPQSPREISVNVNEEIKSDDIRHISPPSSPMSLFFFDCDLHAKKSHKKRKSAYRKRKTVNREIFSVGHPYEMFKVRKSYRTRKIDIDYDSMIIDPMDVDDPNIEDSEMIDEEMDTCISKVYIDADEAMDVDGITVEPTFQSSNASNLEFLFQQQQQQQQAQNQEMQTAEQTQQNRYLVYFQGHLEQTQQNHNLVFFQGHFEQFNCPMEGIETNCSINTNTTLLNNENITFHSFNNSDSYSNVTSNVLETEYNQEMSITNFTSDTEEPHFINNAELAGNLSPPYEPEIYYPQIPHTAQNEELSDYGGPAYDPKNAELYFPNTAPVSDLNSNNLKSTDGMFADEDEEDIRDINFYTKYFRSVKTIDEFMRMMPFFHCNLDDDEQERFDVQSYAESSQDIMDGYLAQWRKSYENPVLLRLHLEAMVKYLIDPVNMAFYAEQEYEKLEMWKFHYCC